MPKDFEGLISLVYRRWKKRYLKAEEAHPGEEVIVSFLEGKLPLQEAEGLKLHLIHCEDCAEAVGLNLTSSGAPDSEFPTGLINFAKEKMGVKDAPALEAVLRLKEKMIEIISASGEILLGQEMLPAAVLRSRNINEFKDEVVILKDFADIRVQIKIENKSGKYFNLNIQAKSKQSKELIKDLRVTLFKEDIELESYLNDSGSVIFEHVLLGKYKVELADLESNLASVLLDVRA
ncbi:MAG: hypothetical protein WC394_02835 [Candidatus Omnitrophota bacterium]|jgi:hypothetical protein